MKQIKIQAIAKIVIDELEAFGSGFRPQTDFGATQERGVRGESTSERNLSKAVSETAEGQKYLATEPFIAYVRALDGNKREHIYFVCRNDLPLRYQIKTPNAKFISYKVPLGRIASLDVGDVETFELPKEKQITLSVIEKNVFTPHRGQVWDATENRLSIAANTTWIDSLRKFYHERPNVISIEKELLLADDDFEDESDEIQTRDYSNARIIESFALRDKPILDGNQDRIFRLPIASQVILTGAPGTGKTTVLIRRLAQKTNLQFVQDETKGLTEQQKNNLFSQSNNWIIFTPNELLKSFIKESLNKEGLPADETHVTAWSDFRTKAARENLSILKSGRDKGVFRLTKERLSEIDINPFDYLQTFEQFYRKKIEDRFKKSVDALNSSTSKQFLEQDERQEIARLYARLAERITEIYKVNFSGASQNTDSLPQIFAGLAVLRQTQEELLKTVRIAIQRIVKRTAQAAPEVYFLIKEKIAAEPNADAKKLPAQTLKELSRVLNQCLSSQPNAVLKSDNAEKNTFKDLWFNIKPLFTPELLSELYESLLPLYKIRNAVSGSKWALSGYAKIMQDVPVYYDEFRQNSIKQGNDSYFHQSAAEEIKEKRLSQDELDCLIYFMLREARNIFRENRRLLDKPPSGLLENVNSLYRTQIVVDEAADFSAVQLGCMANLSHPQFDSIFLAGDLMQRVTTNGIKSWQECQLFNRNFNRQSLVRAYRQSPRLVSLAAKLYENTVGEKADFSAAFDNEEETPEPLVFHAKNNRALSDWLVKRIIEIYESNNNRLPSIAVFVADENKIEELYDLINEPLMDESIEVEKCRDGKVLGTSAKVRIFSVEHIKGLEFGAVFLVNADEIGLAHQGLIDKYLYVALTRATAFLGLTYKNSFPPELAVVQNDFAASDWSSLTTSKNLSKT